MHLDAWGGTDVGRVRERNEDAFGLFPEIGLFAVADGLGGHAAGDVASWAAIREIEREFAAGDAPYHPSRVPAPLATRLLARARQAVGALARSAKRSIPEAGGVVCPEVQDLKRRLEGVVSRANAAVFALSRSREEGSARGMATTVAALAFTPTWSHCAWVHVGDSRIYRCRTGQLSLLTADHTLFGEPYRGGGTPPLDLPHSNGLLRVLGQDPSVQPDLGGDQIVAGDVFLLCSDGISGLLDAHTILGVLEGAEYAREAGQRLIADSLEAGGRDNATLVVVRVLGT